MNIDIKRADLLRSVTSLSRVVTTRSTMQSLSGIMFSPIGSGVRLTATDLELCMEIELKADVDMDDGFVLPGRLLVDIVRMLTGDKVEIKRESASGDVGISCGGAQFTLKTLHADDFPKVPSVDGAEGVSIGVKSIVDTYEWVSKSVSHDETRPILTSINVTAEGDSLRMVATDSYRLSLKEVKLESSVKEGIEANIPARAISEIGKMEGVSEEGKVIIRRGEGQIQFDLGDVKLTSRMIEGQFPNYKHLIPESFDHELKVDTSELLNVIKRVGLMAQKNTPVKLSFSKGKVTISAQTPDVGTASEDVSIDFSADEMEIGFNPDYIRDGLESARSDQVVLRMINPLRPALIETEENGKYVCLIMPVRLNS